MIKELQESERESVPFERKKPQSGARSQVSVTFEPSSKGAVGGYVVKEYWYDESGVQEQRAEEHNIVLQSSSHAL